MSTFNSHSIKIEVKTQFVGIQEQADSTLYAFSYHITIHNAGSQPAQLLRRHWVITDDAGKVQEVYGEGIIGLQPCIQPGKSFSYVSSCILSTAIGIMQGHYEMRCADGPAFKTPIAPFLLTTPRTLH